MRTGQNTRRRTGTRAVRNTTVYATDDSLSVGALLTILDGEFRGTESECLVPWITAMVNRRLGEFTWVPTDATIIGPPNRTGAPTPKDIYDLTIEYAYRIL